MQETEPQKKDVYAILVDAVILGIAVLISIILLVQYNKTAQVTIDTREDRYYRPVNPKTDLIFGNPEADLFIVEYGDLECPYCKEFHTNIKTSDTERLGYFRESCMGVEKRFSCQ